MNRHVWCALGTIHHNDCTLFMGKGCNLTNRIDNAQHIGNLGNRNQFRLIGNQGFHLIQIQGTIRTTFQKPQCGTGLPGNHLPGKQIAVVLRISSPLLILFSP